MSPLHRLLLLALVTLLTFCPALGFPKSFTFELPDRRKMCFYEKIDKSAEYIFNYRVIRGGANDVDVRVVKEDKTELYKRTKSHTDEHTFLATAGRYAFCFSNEFSTISHKLVFFELRPKRFESLQEEAGGTKSSAETLSEATMDAMHVALSQVEEYQTEYRNREAEGRSLSEELNERVFFWSIVIAISILLIGLGQVTVLKAFFTDKHVPGMPLPTKMRYQVPTWMMASAERWQRSNPSGLSEIECAGNILG